MISLEEQKEFAPKIYEMYVKPGARREVNLTGQERDEIKGKLNAPTKYMFAEGGNSCLNLMIMVKKKRKKNFRKKKKRINFDLMESLIISIFIFYIRFISKKFVDFFFSEFFFIFFPLRLKIIKFLRKIF